MHPSEGRVEVGDADVRNRGVSLSRGRGPKADLDAAFAKAHRSAHVEVIPANHGWSVAGSQTYDEAQAERAWAELLPFYRANLR